MKGWRKHRWEEIKKDEWRKWEPWFAWRPVRTISDDRMWLRKVYRRKQVHYDGVNVWHDYSYGTEFDILKGL